MRIPKIVLLYGGEVEHAKSIFRLMNVEPDQRKFGLVILRVCVSISTSIKSDSLQGSGGLADVLAWVCEKFRSDINGLCTQDSEEL